MTRQKIISSYLRHPAGGDFHCCTYHYMHGRLYTRQNIGKIVLNLNEPLCFFSGYTWRL